MDSRLRGNDNTKNEAPCMIKVTVSKKGTPKAMEKALPGIIKDALKRAAKAWRENVLPKHFETGASRKYGYMGRSTGYDRKKRKMGSPPALVYTGRAMRKILADRREPTGTHKQVTLRIPAYGFFNMQYRNWPQGHTMAQEVTAMNKEDLGRIYKDVQIRVELELNAMKDGGLRMVDLRK